MLFHVEVSFFLSPPLSFFWKSFREVIFRQDERTEKGCACLPMLSRQLVHGIAHVPSSVKCLSFFTPGTGLRLAHDTISAGEAVIENHR